MKIVTSTFNSACALLTLLLLCTTEVFATNLGKYKFTVATIDNPSYKVEPVHYKSVHYTWYYDSLSFTVSVRGKDSTIHTQLRTQYSYIADNLKKGDRYTMIYDSTNPSRYEVLLCQPVFKEDAHLDSAHAKIISVDNHGLTYYLNAQYLDLYIWANHTQPEREVITPTYIGTVQKFDLEYFYPGLDKGLSYYIRFEKERPNRVYLGTYSPTDTGNLTKAAIYPPLEKRYVTLSFLGPGMLFYPSTAGTLSINFPYTVSDNAGTHYNTFHSVTSNPFSFTSFTIGIMYLEAGGPKFFWNFSGGDNTQSGTATLLTGIGCNFYLTHWHLFLSKLKQPNGIIIKPSLNLAYYGFVTNLGNINNNGNTVYIFGNTALPTFTTTSKNVVTTHTSDHLNAVFKQNDYGISPKISISSNHFNRKLHWEINIAYFIPFSEDGGVRLEQISTDGTTTLFAGYVHDLVSPISATFNNNPITKSPFTFHNLYIGFSLGVNLVHFDKLATRYVF